MYSPHIPTDSLSVIGEFALGSKNELAAFNAIARGFRTATTCIDSKVWELEFKARDPDLHACISACGDERNNWRERVRRIVDTSKMFSRQAPVPGFASVDVVLHNHPSHGFQVNIGVEQDAVVVYSLRKEAGVQSSSEIFLGPLGLPFNDDPTNVTSALTTLYLVSIDGVEVSTLSGPEELIRVVRGSGSGELSHWRFVCLPSNDTETAIPTVCRFAPTPVRAGQLKKPTLDE